MVRFGDVYMGRFPPAKPHRHPPKKTTFTIITANTQPPMNPNQFIGWLSKLRRQYGKIFRIFTGNRAYIVLMDKVVGRQASKQASKGVRPHMHTMSRGWDAN